MNSKHKFQPQNPSTNSKTNSNNYSREEVKKAIPNTNLKEINSKTKPKNNSKL